MSRLFEFAFSHVTSVTIIVNGRPLCRNLAWLTVMHNKKKSTASPLRKFLESWLHPIFWYCIVVNARPLRQIEYDLERFSMECLIPDIALLRSVIGWKNSRHLLSQWETKPKPISGCTRVFSRAWRPVAFKYFKFWLVRWAVRLRLLRLIALVLVYDALLKTSLIGQCKREYWNKIGVFEVLKEPSIAHYASRASVVGLVFTGARRLLFSSAQCIMDNTGSLNVAVWTVWN